MLAPGYGQGEGVLYDVKECESTLCCDRGKWLFVFLCASLLISFSTKSLDCECWLCLPEHMAIRSEEHLST